MTGFLMARIAEIWRSWSKRKRLLVAGGAGLAVLAAGGAIAYFTLVKRDQDVSCPPPCELEAEQTPKPKEVVKTVDWPVYGYDDQRTRYLPTKRVKPPFDASVWSFAAGKLLEFSPIVADDSLYFQDIDSLFYSLDADTGKVQWKQMIGARGAASPAYVQGRVIAVTLEPGEAVALRARDGKILWRRPLGGRSETSPVVVGDKVIVGGEAGSVYALDIDSGKVLWQVQTDGAVKGGLALDEGVLYGGNYAGQVFAIRASDGSYVWQSSTQGLSFGRGGPVYSTPAVAFGRVFLGSIDNRVYSFDQDSGAVAWSHSTGDWVYAAPAVADTPKTEPTVYVGSKDQTFYALDAETGAVRWSKHIGGVILGAATVLGETVYVAGLGPNVGTFGFDVKTGKNVFESELGEYNPVISDGERMYLTGAAGIRAFEHETAAERRRDAERRRNERAKKAEKEKRQAAARRAKSEGQGAAQPQAGAREQERRKEGKGNLKSGGPSDGS